MSRGGAGNDRAFSAGVAVRDITPEVGCDLLPGVHLGRIQSTDISGPLKAKALVLKSPQETLVLCSVELAYLTADLVEHVRERIVERTGIGRRSIMIGATHTHSGPIIDRRFEELDLGRISEGYPSFVENQIADAVFEAITSAGPGLIAVGRGEEPRLVFNRRLRRPDGRIVMNFAGMEHLTDCERSPVVDPTVGVIDVRAESGIPLALVVNYACHNNALLGTAVSPDWAGYLEGHVQDLLGLDVPVLFFPGCCGNVNYFDHTVGGRGEQEAQRIAATLAAAVVKITSRSDPHGDALLGSMESEIELHHRKPMEIDQTDDGCFGNSTEAFIDFFNRELARVDDDEEAKTYACPINAFRIANSIWISSPAELFVEFGLEMKQRSPYGPSNTFINTLTNGHCGYVPTREAFGEGGFEVRWRSISSFLEVGAGDLIVQESLRLANALHADAP